MQNDMVKLVASQKHSQQEELHRKFNYQELLPTILFLALNFAHASFRFYTHFLEIIQIIVLKFTNG
jgi:hypothetical protein